MKRTFTLLLVMLVSAVAMAQTPKVSDLTATGTSIKWYLTATGGTPLDPGTPLVNGQHYYASQTLNGCESTNRLEVVATVTPCVTVPTVTTSAASNVAGTNATLNGNLTATGGANATTRGFKYSTTSGFDPASIGTTISESGSFSTGTFSLVVSGLTPGTTYYANAFAAKSAGTAYGTQVNFTIPLYSIWTFTPAGATSYEGPTQAMVNAAYSGTSLQGQVTVNTLGIQEWIVPSTATYRVEAYGAQGGSIGGYTGGYGAKMSGEFSLTAGNILHIIAGQPGIGVGAGAGGGGGSFVVKSPYNTNASILTIAGGGGGATSYVPGYMNGYPGLTGTSGGTTSNPGGDNLGMLRYRSRGYRWVWRI